MNFFKNFSNKPTHEIAPGFRGRFEHSKSITMAFWEIDEGSVLPEHSHHHEQIATVYKGKFELTVDGITQVLVPGMTAIIPSNVKHSGLAKTDCEITDVFTPIREDYMLD